MHPVTLDSNNRPLLLRSHCLFSFPTRQQQQNKKQFFVVDVVSICRNNRNERRRAWNGSNFIITIISSPLGFLRLLTSTAGLKIRGRNTHTTQQFPSFKFLFFLSLSLLAPSSFPPPFFCCCMFSEHVCGSRLWRATVAAVPPNDEVSGLSPSGERLGWGE